MCLLLASSFIMVHHDLQASCCPECLLGAALFLVRYSVKELTGAMGNIAQQMWTIQMAPSCQDVIVIELLHLSPQSIGKQY